MLKQIVTRSHVIFFFRYYRFNFKVISVHIMNCKYQKSAAASTFFASKAVFYLIDATKDMI